MNPRINQTFEKLRSANKKGFVTFVTAGDPDPVTSQNILNSLPDAGVDIIELGMPFTDPMADGPAIQAANLRALANGMTLTRTLEMVREFRNSNQTTPVVLMGYMNPIESYGTEKFVNDAASAGVDGLILVDLPPEEDAFLRGLAADKDIAMIRLTTPTTLEGRIQTVVKHASGFVYYVSVRGITGQQSAGESDIQQAMAFIKSHTDLPIALGFGIREPEQAAVAARYADAVVVGSALVELCGGADPVENVAKKVRILAEAVHSAR